MLCRTCDPTGRPDLSRVARLTLHWLIVALSALWIAVPAAADQATVDTQGVAAASPPDPVQPAPAAATGTATATAPDAATAPEAEAVDEAVSLAAAGESAKNLGIRVFFSAVVLMIAFLVVEGGVYVLDRLAERIPRRRLVIKRMAPVLRLVLWTFALYVVIRGIFQVDAKGILAAAAAIGVAVGFAAQDLLKNIFGGLVIISERPFQVGDKISVGETYGEVASIGLRSTRIVTPDDNLVTVPNSMIVSSQVANANAGALDCQVVTHLYLPGWVDETAAKRLAYQAAASSKYVYLKKPIVVIVLDEFDQTFVTHLKVKAYVLDTRYEFLLVSDITERARRAFRDAGMIGPRHGAQSYVHVSGVGDDGGDATGSGHRPDASDARRPAADATGTAT